MPHYAEISGEGSRALREFLKPSQNAVALVHPEMPMLGIMWIPEEYVLKTAGAQKSTKSQPHIPSLCLLFQHTRCNSREACNQIHVDRDFAQHLRHLLSTAQVSNCCRRHGDLGSSISKLFTANERVELRAPGAHPLPVPADRLAVTEYWTAAFSVGQLKDKATVMSFPPTRVCNLHQRQACKYGSACKNVHVCRGFWQQCAQPSLAATPMAMPSQFGAVPLPELAPPILFPLAGPLMPSLPPAPKRASRALLIVDPSSGQAVQVKAAPPPVLPEAPTLPHAGLAQDLALFGHKAAGSNPPEDPLCLSLEHLDLMTMALNMDMQHLFPLPFDLETEFQDPVPESTAAESESSTAITPNRPESPGNSSGTDISFGEDSWEDDMLRKGPPRPFKGPMWRSLFGPPVGDVQPPASP